MSDTSLVLSPALPPPLLQMIDLAALKARHDQIGELMKSILRPGVDYISIDGERPCLRKAGAETLCAAFSLAPSLSSITTEDDVVRVVQVWDTEYVGRRKTRVPTDAQIRGRFEALSTCRILCGDRFLGQASGSCSSLERQYLRQDQYDLRNTIIKMAEKRALVAAVLIVTGASRVFTQDLDDRPPNQNGRRWGRPTPPPPVDSPPPSDPGPVEPPPPDSPPASTSYWQEQIRACRSDEEIDALRDRMNREMPPAARRPQGQGEILRRTIEEQRAVIRAADPTLPGFVAACAVARTREDLQALEEARADMGPSAEADAALKAVRARFEEPAPPPPDDAPPLSEADQGRPSKARRIRAR